MSAICANTSIQVSTGDIAFRQLSPTLPVLFDTGIPALYRPVRHETVASFAPHCQVEACAKAFTSAFADRIALLLRLVLALLGTVAQRVRPTSKVQSSRLATEGSLMTVPLLKLDGRRRCER